MSPGQERARERDADPEKSEAPDERSGRDRLMRPSGDPIAMLPDVPPANDASEDPDFDPELDQAPTRRETTDAPPDDPALAKALAEADKPMQWGRDEAPPSEAAVYVEPKTGPGYRGVAPTMDMASVKLRRDVDPREMLTAPRMAKAGGLQAGESKKRILWAAIGIVTVGVIAVAAFRSLSGTDELGAPVASMSGGPPATAMIALTGTTTRTRTDTGAATDTGTGSATETDTMTGAATPSTHTPSGATTGTRTNSKTGTQTQPPSGPATGRTTPTTSEPTTAPSVTPTPTAKPSASSTFPTRLLGTEPEE